MHLFNGSTGALISTLLGSSASDRIGLNGLREVGNSNFVIVSSDWDNAGVQDKGAVTWINGVAGLSGTINSSNSLIGTFEDDIFAPRLHVLPNGNFLVHYEQWDNVGAVDAGAVTFGNGNMPLTGVVSAANTLVGMKTHDLNTIGVTFVAGGNVVISSWGWDGGDSTIEDVGAVIWVSATAGISGTISADNALVGSVANDRVGQHPITVLTNGNYVVRSPIWDNSGVADVGAVTWANGLTGLTGVVSTANSLFGTTASDEVGSEEVTALPNGNYLVQTSRWDGVAVDVGAVTFCIGTAPTVGAVSAANSLVGSTAGDGVGGDETVTALTNGNYVVRSGSWDNLTAVDAGAVTWGNGTTGVFGQVSPANSLVGSKSGDVIGSQGVTALANGNYVVASPILGQRRHRRRRSSNLGQRRVGDIRHDHRRQLVRWDYGR